MKRYLLIACFLLASLPAALSQEKTEVFDFIKECDWSQSEESIVNKYKDRVLEELSIDGFKTYKLSRFTIQEQDVKVIYGCNPAFHALVIVHEHDSEKLKQYMIAKLGQPLNPNKNITKILYQAGLPYENDALSWMDKNAMYISLKDSHLILYLNSSNGKLLEINKPDPALRPQKDFRKGRWGDSRAKIESLEGKVCCFTEPNSYVFESMLGEYPCFAGYTFFKDKLVSGKYVIKKVNKENYNIIYIRLATLLSQKYGQAAISFDSQASLETFNDIENATKEKVWITPATNITLNLVCEDSDFDIIITYTYTHSMEITDKEILDDL